MATLAPLEFDLSGFDQFKRPGAGVGAAGYDANAEQMRKVVEASRARAAAARAPASAAPSVPVGENPAPVSTAHAANSPSFGRRLMRMGGRVLGPLSAGLAGFEAGQLLTPDKVAVGAASALGSLGKLLGIDSLAQYAGGSQQYAAAQDAPEPARVAPAPAPAPVVAAAAPAASAANPSITPLSPQAAAVAASRFLDGREVPADRTGYVRNESTGGVTAVDSRTSPVRMGRYVQPAPAAEENARPQLGTQGGIFGNLSNFVNDFGKYSIANAERNRGTKVALKSEDLDIKREDSRANRETQAQNAESSRMKAYADILKEITTANKENVSVLPGLDGNPILVDKKARTATKVTPSEKPTWEKFRDEARKDPNNKKFTDAQLKAYHQKNYGG